MPRFLLLSALMLLAFGAAHSQSSDEQHGNPDLAIRKSLLIGNLQSLDAEAEKLDRPLARAAAKTEIADAAWMIERAWAKSLLSEAYELTFPDEEERNRLRGQPTGAAPKPPTPDDAARANLRSRIFKIASRDKDFADQLAQTGFQQLGKLEEHHRYSSLASQSIKAGDLETAGHYIRRALAADPTQGTVAFSILDVAARDRALADRLIVEFIERVRAVPISMTDRSALRTYFVLQQMVFPAAVEVQERGGQIQPASRTALSAYVGYVIESMSKLARTEPESLRALRLFLLPTWTPLSRYAPELAATFWELEKLGRRPGEAAWTPPINRQESNRINYEKRLKEAFDSRQPDDYAFASAFGREDFAAVGKMLDMLPDGERKARFTEQLNTLQAVGLAESGELVEAEKFARRLSRASSILQVYPVIIGKCVAAKDDACATALAFQATKQLRQVADEQAVPLSLSKLAAALVPINSGLAFELLEQAIEAANLSNVSTEQGQTAMDVEAFRTLAPKDTNRALQSAAALKDRLSRITALAAVYQWEAGEMT